MKVFIRDVEFLIRKDFLLLSQLEEHVGLRDVKVAQLVFMRRRVKDDKSSDFLACLDQLLGDLKGDKRAKGMPAQQVRPLGLNAL